MLFGLGAYWAGSVTDDYLPPGLPGYVDARLYPDEHPNFTKGRALALGADLDPLGTASRAPYTRDQLHRRLPLVREFVLERWPQA